MPDVILVLNAGSSSLKFSAFAVGGGAALAHGQVSGIGAAPKFVLHGADGSKLDQQQLDASTDQEQALGVVLERCAARFSGSRAVAVGHRVVHGGVRFASPVRIDDAVLAELEALVPLAPLHQPHNLAAVRAVSRRAPQLPQVACFDTAFHRTQPPVAQRIALPRRFADLGVCRYGFHGLSYEYIASRLPQLDPTAAQGRTVVATGAELGPSTQLSDCDVGSRAVVTATIGQNAAVGADARVGPWAYLPPGKKVSPGSVTGACFTGGGAEDDLS